ncbi:MAG: hypothetical protein JNM36_13095 [Chitinophagales bacterium]|nr:hypothetical protein [Chitinophagales bacterium]
MVADRPRSEQFYAWTPYNSNLDNPVVNTDPDGDFCVPCLTAIGGGLLKAGEEMGGQLLANGGDMSKVDWIDVGVEGFNGMVKGSGVGLVFSGATETIGTGVKATFDYTSEKGHENYFNGKKSGESVIYDAAADVLDGKATDYVGSKIVKASDKAVTQAGKNVKQANKDLGKAQRSYNKATDGGKNLNVPSAGVKNILLNQAQKKAIIAKTTQKGVQQNHTLIKSPAGNVAKTAIENKTTGYVKEKMGIGVD